MKQLKRVVYGGEEDSKREAGGKVKTKEGRKERV